MVTRVHILPSMNPDGWKIATDHGGKDYLIGRNNANDIDLNRDFPDLNQVVDEGAEENNHLLREANFDHRIQPETESVIKMIMDTPFVVSANMHGGDWWQTTLMMRARQITPPSTLPALMT